MKHLLIAFVLTVSSFSAMALDDQISSSNVNIFVSSERMWGKCKRGDGNGCMASSSTSSTISFFATTFGRYKEEIRQVEPDAYQFLAGEEKTLALDHVINLIREDSEELHDLSDLEITSLIIEGVE